MLYAINGRLKNAFHITREADEVERVQGNDNPFERLLKIPVAG